MNERVGWIGTGVMGGPMCGHLLDAGYRVAVFNRSKERARALLEKGAEWRDSPAAVARDADVIFTIVGFPSDVREVVLGP
ncbi:MAG: NAD(P)-binding domain-containing protein, partial [Candidatus Binatia bacterium]